MNDKRITDQQKRFLNEYAQSLDIEKSAHSAGYKSTNALSQARSLLKKDFYRGELEKLMAERAQYLDVCKGFVIKKYLEIVNYASQIENGTPKDPVLGLRALDGLCKHLPKTEIGAENETLITKIEGLNQERI